MGRAVSLVGAVFALLGVVLVLLVVPEPRMVGYRLVRLPTGLIRTTIIVRRM
jgi:hypothetical protein